MSPDRKTFVNNNKIEEFWWAGEFVVYINNRSTEETYEEAIERLSKENDDDTLSNR